MTVHVVKRGETLSTIAKLYSTTIDRLTTVNSIQDANKISVGQSLNIPAQRQYSAPVATLKPANESKTATDTSTFDLTQRIGDVVYQQLGIWHGILDALLQRFRTVEANESVQHNENATLTKQTQPVKAVKEAPPNKHSQSNKSLSEVKQKLKEQLGKEAHVVTFNGVKLTENEKKQIMASVAVCEMNKDGFGTINPDGEFGGKGGFGTLTYKHIVHIGLSYGLIQYTQDGGALGEILKEMRCKNSGKFIDIFGGGDAAIAQSLVELCTTGRPDLANNPNIPLSGLSHWQKIKKKKEGQEILQLASKDENKDGKSDLPSDREIRGKRVQPIKASKDSAPIDIWTGIWKQRFLEAGQVTDFQEVQISVAVRNYMNPVIGMAKTNNLRSAMGLAFFIACAVRHGAFSNPGTKLIFEVAKELGFTVPFEKSADEVETVKAISEAKPLNKEYNHIGNVRILKIETHRAKSLLKDELGFLAEDLYDINTY